MIGRSFSSLLCISALAGQLLNAQSLTTVANADSATILSQMKAQIAAQQEQIRKLQLAVDQQQKLLEQTLANVSAATVDATAGTTTSDGTAVVAARNDMRPVTLVPAVNKSVKPDIVNRPRYLDDGEKTKASPLSVSIGNSTFTPFGFVDFILFGRSTNVGSGIGTSFSGIPYNTGVTGHIAEQNISMQNSRLGFRVNSTYKGAKILGYLEMDFLGNQPAGLFQTSNSDTFRMRNVFVDVQKGKLEILAGQDWTMFTANRKGLSPIPGDIFFSQAVDTNYLAGLIWARQSQFRLVAHPNDHFTFGMSLENPQQFIGGGVTLPSTLSSQLITELNNGATNYSAPNVHPDIIFKAAADSKMFHVEAGSLIRTFKVATSTGTAPTLYTAHSATAVSGEVNGIASLTKSFRLIANSFFGSGGGRYIGGTGPDLIVRADGSLSPVHQLATTDGFEANLTKNNLLYAYYSGSTFKKNVAMDSTGKLVGYGFAGSALTNNKSIQEATIGYAPTFWKSDNYGALNLNLQYSYLIREPWSIPAAGPKSAHTNLYYINLRYTLP